MLALRVTRNKTGICFLTVIQADGSPQNLTGCTLYFHAHWGSFTLNKDSTISGGITITDIPGGLATLEIVPAESANVYIPVADGAIAIPCELTLTPSSGGERFPLDSGTLTICGNVGTP